MKLQISYTLLLQKFIEVLSSKISRQQIKNFRTAINSWQKMLKLNERRIVGDEFGIHFLHYQSIYAKKLDNEGLKASTKASRLSIIKKLRTFFLQETNEFLTSSNFHEILSHFLTLRGFSVSKFREYFLVDSVTTRTLQMWINGTRVPGRSRQSTLEEIEKHLSIPKGMLVSSLIWSRKGKTGSGNSTKFGNRVRVNGKKTYSITTKQVDEEFVLLRKFKSASVLDEGLERTEGALWTDSEGVSQPTAKKTKCEIALFLGFCSLSESNKDPMLRGLGMKSEKLTLALLAEKTILEKYLMEFKLARTGGKFHHGYLTFISLVTSLLRKDTGYLYQKPEFAAKLGLCFTDQEWQTKCLDTRNRLLKIKSAIEEAKKSGSSDFELGRNPEEPIANILALPQPVRATMAMVMAMFGDTAKLSTSPLRQACLYRDALLLTLLQANPLRVKMFRIMKFDENLVREADGSWWIKFHRNTFKNRHSLSSNYAARLTPEVWSMIEIYKEKFRCLFPASETSSHVFLSAADKFSKFKDQNDKSVPGLLNLSAIVLRRTKQYIDNNPGFSAHSFRHVISTNIIKSNPEFGFFLAAKVLHDKLETVEKYYAHLKTSDFIEPYNREFSALWKSVKLNHAATDKKSKIGGNTDETT